MFDTPDLLTPTLQCLVIIFVALGLAYLAGLIPALLILNKDLALPVRKRLSFSIAAMSLGALGIVILCILLAFIAMQDQWQISHGFEGAICTEAEISAKYKLVVTQLRDGSKYAGIESLDGKSRISRVQQYAVIGNYVTGKSDDEYFWFDLGTGAYRYLDNRDEFEESLGRVGISPPPGLLATDSVCKTWACHPCVRLTPTR